MVFSVVTYGCECWSIKKAENQRVDAFKLCCWKIILRVPWTTRRSHQSILKEINYEYSLEGLLLGLMLPLLTRWCEKLTHWKRPWYWERLRAGEGGDNRVWNNSMVSPTQWRWVWTPRDNEVQGSLMCCSPWSHKELAWHSDWTELNIYHTI